MNQSIHSPTASGTPNPPPTTPGFRQRAQRWVTAGKSRQWWNGLGLLRFHFSVYVAVVPILFVVNLIQSPADLWIDRAALAWLALLVLHAAVVGLIWAIAIWQREATETERPPGATLQPRSTWITSRDAVPQDATFRTTTTDGHDAPLASWGPPVNATGAGSSIWGEFVASHRDLGGRHTPEASSAPGSPWDTAGAVSAPAALPSATTGETVSSEKRPAPDDRVSWRAVTDAAWLTPTEPNTSDEVTHASPSSPADDRKPA